MKRNFLSFFLILIILSGCGKEEKSMPPVVEIFEPYSGQQYIQGDTIFYRFKVSDDEAVTNVKVSISNSSNQAVTSHNYINAGKSKEYEGFFLTESFAVLGSTHHFVVSATDGENETRLGGQLSIFLAEKKTLGIFAATVSGISSYDVMKIDSLFNIQPVMTRNGDFLKMKISSKENMIYSSGKYSGDLFANSINGGVVWSEPANSIAGNPYFHNIDIYDDFIFVSYDNEQIKAYDKNKNIKFSANAGSDNYAVNLIKNENIVLTEQRSYPYIETKLTSYHFGSGAPLKSISIGEVKVKEFFVKDSNTFIIIGNENNKGLILYYDYAGNNITQPYQIPSGDSIIAAEFIPYENTILLQMTSGLNKFVLSNNNLLPVEPGSFFEILKFDEVQNRLVTAQGTNIYFYTYPQLQLIISVSVSSPVKDLEILYNR